MDIDFQELTPDTAGLLKKRGGSQVPTVEYTYDSQGRVKTMTTTGQAGPGVTTWTYQITTGWPLTKTYPDGDTISHTYSAAGRLLTRDTGRGVTRTCAYDQGGRLTGVNYSDTTPDVTYTLNRLGQITGITDGVGTRSRTVATDGRILSETHGSGPNATTYTYAANSGLVSQVSTTHGGAPALATTTAHDFLERLTSIGSSASGAVVSSHGYTYDDLNRRTESVLEDGGKWEYQYDPMGQVISGQKKTATGADVPGMAFGYAFDGIGNRTSATVNGRTGTYTADSANQYTRRQVPGALDIRGRAHMAAKVTVNAQAVQRLDEYFHKALAVDNSAAPQYPGVSVLAVRGHAGPNGEDLQSQTTGNLYLPKTPETFTHDAEGNLTQDGRWTYTWDGENRLIRMETLAAVPAAAKRRLEFAYDSENRRVRKQVSHWNGGAWTLQSDRRYLYDGWNPVAELDASNTMLRNFVWGLDLSGSPQGAGGVGGLLAIREGAESHLPCYDGNGNVMALVRASDRTVSARYEYGPFGETLAVEENGVSNPFRFSTKFTDEETGLLYYGYRYYDPVTGRWPSRDPIGERGGVNLYGFVGNNGVNQWDYLGLTIWTTDFGILENDAGFWSVLNHAINTWENINPGGIFGNGQGRDYLTDIKYLGIGPSVTSGGADGNLKDQHPELFTKVCAMKEGGTISVKHDVNNWFSNQRPWTIGHINLRVTGSLTKICPRGKKMWKFDGGATAHPDKFDFNQMHRAGVTTNRDIAIGILDFLQRNSSRWFYIKPQGALSFKDIGSCK